MSTNSVTVKQNYWRVPSVENAFSGWLEGAPSDAERLQVIAKTIAKRKTWVPNSKALALVEKLKNFIGYRVQIEFWDSCMWLTPREGPYPLNSTVRGVVVLKDGDHLQAFLELSDLAEQPNVDGYSPMAYLQNRAESEFLLAPLADLYSIKKI
jgi:hypothetical protein